MKPGLAEPTIVAKPSTLAELAILYEVSAHTMRKWLKVHDRFIGPRIGHTYTTLQVLVIFDRLGLPPSA